MNAASGRSESGAARQILLVAHPGRAELTETAHRVAKIFENADIELRVLEDEAYSTRFDTDEEGRPDGYPVKVTKHGPDSAVGCEMVLALGGDGTFLRAAELAREASVPVLGINLGRIGFLTEAEADHLDEALAQVVRRDYTIEKRMTIDVTVRVDDTVTERGWALNEASIENAARMGVLEVILEVDGRPVSAFGCDGVLVATPTGSTAYAFSAGGPVVWPQVEAILMVPLSAHALYARPMVVGPGSTVSIELVRASEGLGVMWCDGRRTVELPRAARIDVRRGKTPVRLARVHEAPFTDRLVAKFDLPVLGWRGTAERKNGRSG